MNSGLFSYCSIASGEKKKHSIIFLNYFYIIICIQNLFNFCSSRLISDFTWKIKLRNSIYEQRAGDKIWYVIWAERINPSEISKKSPHELFLASDELEKAGESIHSESFIWKSTIISHVDYARCKCLSEARLYFACRSALSLVFHDATSSAIHERQKKNKKRAFRIHRCICTRFMNNSRIREFVRILRIYAAAYVL